MPTHDGHRQRLKERYCTEGLDSFHEIQALELMLFYAIPRVDTNPIAHALLDEFGSFAGVLDAPLSELRKVPGIGENAAVFLSLFRNVMRYYGISSAGQQTVLSSLSDCGNYLLPRFLGKRNEEIYMLCLDAKCKVLLCREVGQGSVSFASLPIRRVVEQALAVNAFSVVMAHNHPSGLAIPSQEDLNCTYRLSQALDGVDIKLLDHIIAADDDFVSIAVSYPGCLCTKE